MPGIKYGFEVPHTVARALENDVEAGNTLWAEAIRKEMTAMFEMTVFQEWKDPSPPKRDDGWQFAPLRLIFDIKHDGRHKARMVLGGHVPNASGFDSYASTVKTERTPSPVHNSTAVYGGMLGYFSAYSSAIPRVGYLPKRSYTHYSHLAN